MHACVKERRKKRKGGRKREKRISKEF